MRSTYLYLYLSPHTLSSQHSIIYLYPFFLFLTHTLFLSISLSLSLPSPVSVHSSLRVSTLIYLIIFVYSGFSRCDVLDMCPRPPQECTSIGIYMGYGLHDGVACVQVRLRYTKNRKCEILNTSRGIERWVGKWARELVRLSSSRYVTLEKGNVEVIEESEATGPEE